MQYVEAEEQPVTHTDSLDAINGCMSFNTYFERDPSLEPGSGCTDPASVTMIKCVFWGGPVSASNANNYGQYRSKFQLVLQKNAFHEVYH